jgi:hypothetical protein
MSISLYAKDLLCIFRKKKRVWHWNRYKILFVFVHTKLPMLFQWQSTVVNPVASLRPRYFISFCIFCWTCSHAEHVLKPWRWPLNNHLQQIDLFEIPIALKSDSTHHFFRNACTKSGSLRFSQFSGCWLILSVYNTYEFWLSLCKIVRSSVILLLPLFAPIKRSIITCHI